MATHKLKDIEIKRAKVKKQNYTLGDGGGLQILVKKSGSKSWEYIYKSPTTLKRRKAGLGSYPNITLENARKKAIEYRDLIANGIDPIEHYKQIKQQIQQTEIKKSNPKTTIEYISNRHFDIKQHNRSLKDITINKTKAMLELHFYPYLPQQHKTQINNITYEIVIDLLHRIENKNKLETLGRVRGLILKILKYAYSENILDNPELITKIEFKTFKKVHKNNVKNAPTITDPKKIKLLLLGISDYQGELYTKYALLFSIHTAQRQGSIISAKWEHIDFDNRLWNIPASNMKMKIEHILPLSNQVIDILKELKKYTVDSDYLFPNTQYINRHMSENTVNNALRRLGYTKDEIVAHGFRAMFSTICNEYQTIHKLPFDVIEKALAHKEKNEIRAVYNRAKNLEELTSLMQWWSNWLDEVKL